MCNSCGYSQEDVKRFMRLGEYSARILQGESIADIAVKDGRPPDVVEKELREIKPINPYLYRQLFGED